MSQEHWRDERGVTHEVDLAPGRRRILLCETRQAAWWPRRRPGTVPITCLACVARAPRPSDARQTLPANGMKGLI